MVVSFPIFLIMQRWTVPQQLKIQGVSGCVVGHGFCLRGFVAVKIGMLIGRTGYIFLAVRLYSTKISGVECKERTRFLGPKSSVDGALQGGLPLFLILLLAFASGVVPEKEVHIDRLVAPFIMLGIGDYTKLNT